MQTALEARPEPLVQLLTETEYFSQTGQSVSRLLKFVAYGIGGCMLLGALAVALNAMYSCVSTRVIEIATLRALGFSSPAIVTALFLEALVLSLIGALIGAGIAWTFFQHKEISTLTGASAAQLTYSLQITASLVASAIAIACVVGLTGGLFPAVRVRPASELPSRSAKSRRSVATSLELSVCDNIFLASPLSSAHRSACEPFDIGHHPHWRAC